MSTIQYTRLENTLPSKTMIAPRKNAKSAFFSIINHSRFHRHQLERIFK